MQSEASFPRGSLRYGDHESEFRSIGRQYGGGWDVDMIADGFRAQMGERLEKLRGAKLAAAWKGFCEGWVNRRGRPQ
jgi:hypothetical protein